MTDGTANSLAARLVAAEERAFVGREAELERFAAMLRQEADSPAVLYVHGIGGVGKTTLLQRLATKAREAGRAVVRIEGRRVDPSPRGFEQAASGALSDAKSVLLVDSFEYCQGLEGWLREQFLPGLPETVPVVVAGRQPPSSQWICDIAWSDALAVLEMCPLDEEHAQALLTRHGIPSALRKKIMAFAGGHPLALRIAASLMSADGDTQADWEPTPHIISALLADLVGSLPTQQHRTALETAAHALTLNRNLLAAVMGEASAGPMFDWLCGLPFTELGPQGVSVHDLVAQILDRDMRWRDPEGYLLMHHRAGRYLLDRTRATREAESIQAVRELTYLKRHGPMQAYFESTQQEGDVWEERLHADDHDIVVKMIAQVEDEESVRIGRYWLERQPEAFWLYRDTRTGAPKGFMAWLRLTRREESDLMDPVVAAAWEHAESHGPLRTGQHLRIGRFFVGESSYGGISSVEHLMQLHVVKDWLRAVGMAWTFITTAHADLWRNLMHFNSHRQVSKTVLDSGRVWTTFGYDWRTESLGSWFDRTWSLLPPAEPESVGHGREPALEKGAFAEAIRAALRDLHRSELLQENPLVTTLLMSDRAHHTGTPAQQLRHVLLETVESLRRDARQAKAYQALRATYTVQHRTQEAAAALLGIPFSTYRRHLAQGIDRVVELLWQREVTLSGESSSLSQEAARNAE
ncbi:ATP-binding protein [Streptomyces cavernae]|uniref:ATP-binding protein n=1 Tax=Streptomyces cavernae TaxID=2259034 RepID=UPI001390B308|nr:ATP-binding protein [Streptomyces cavernae]